MNSEENTSPKITVEGGAKEDRIVTKEELKTLIETEPLYTVVRVKDDDYKYHILLDDIVGEKFWSPFSGDVEFAKKSNEWFKQGQKLFEDRPLTQEESNELRECLLAISTLGNFFQWTEETVGSFMDNLIVTFSYRLYAKKNGDKALPLEQLSENEEFMTYLNATAIFVKAYAELVCEVKASVKTAAEDQAVVDKTV